MRSDSNEDGQNLGLARKVEGGRDCGGGKREDEWEREREDRRENGDWRGGGDLLSSLIAYDGNQNAFDRRSLYKYGSDYFLLRPPSELRPIPFVVG